jgi:hypothetical protein
MAFLGEVGFSSCWAQQCTVGSYLRAYRLTLLYEVARG